jgi:hypothetical protein
MKLTSLLSLFAFFVSLPVFAVPQLQVANASPSSLIKDFEPIDSNSGLIFTSDSMFRTDDAGTTWTMLPVPIVSTERIASVLFDNPTDGIVVLADSTSNYRLSIARTTDGGKSWTRSGIELENASAYELDMENTTLSGEPAGLLELTVRVPTSSNFDGRAIYHSTDGGATWLFVDRSVELRRNDDDDASAIKQKGNWSVETTGECQGFKTGCVQETRLYLLGKEITPSQIKELAVGEKEKARTEAAPKFGASPGGSTRISLQRGFDKCTNGSVTQMQVWWNTSHFFDANIYMSGRNRACAQTLTASWVTQVSTMGWGLIPTIVGYQSPCTASATTAKFSFDPVVAEQQGRGEADIAVADAINIGLTAGSILYYDMERYDETVNTPGCRVASTAFLKGWTDRIKELGYKSGTYGSPKNAQEDWVTLPAASKMDAIWMARWDNVPSVWTYVSFPTFPTNEWANHQRIKQWQAPHNETWGGVTFNIDGNIADGPVAGPAIPKNRNADFDGDGKTDISVFRPDTGQWWVINSATSTVSIATWGLAADIPAPGDYDGDGKTDYAVYRPSEGLWYTYGKAGVVSVVKWGLEEDIPVPADYNGDGKTDRAIFRPSSGIWYIANSNSLGMLTFAQWGIAEDKPVPADYDGDGKTDIALYRPSEGNWYIVYSSNQEFVITHLGVATDKPTQGDYDGDGKADIAVYRDGLWYLRQSTAGPAVIQFGLAGDLPVTGYYDGDDIADISLYRPSEGVWYLLQSQAGFGAGFFGSGTDKPVPAAYLPQ